MPDKRTRFKEKLAWWLDATPQRIHLYWKGRVALYALLKAMGIEKGDEVILPAFTCVVVPNAIIEAGGQPVYVDIEEETLNPTPSAIKAAMSERTKIVIVQNSFGLSSYVDEIHKWTKGQGIYSIEDCTHGFGGTFKGRPNGTYCDAAFYSTQWNKPFSSGVGGFALINDESLLPAIERLNAEKRYPGVKDRTLLRLLYAFRKRFLTEASYWPLLKAYRKLSRSGLLPASSQKEELAEPGMPEGFFMDLSETQAALGLDDLESLEERLQLRRKNARIYSDCLKELGKSYVKDELFPDHSFLKYPVFVKEREHFFELAEKARIPLGDWFLSPLHPVEGDLSPWGLNVKEIPIARQKAAQVLNLPTDIERSDRVTSFLRENQGFLL